MLLSFRWIISASKRAYSTIESIVEEDSYGYKIHDSGWKEPCPRITSFHGGELYPSSEDWETKWIRTALLGYGLKVSICKGSNTPDFYERFSLFPTGLAGSPQGSIPFISSSSSGSLLFPTYPPTREIWGRNSFHGFTTSGLGCFPLLRERGFSVEDLPFSQTIPHKLVSQVIPPLTHTLLLWLLQGE